MEVRVMVDGQRLSFVDSGYRFAPQSQEFIKFRFDLSPDWDGLMVFAQWTQNGTSYNAYLDEENCVFMPSEITSGECTMMLYGTGTGGIIGTTHTAKLLLSKDAFVSDGQSTVITQSLYDQLVERLIGYVPYTDVATLEEAKQYLHIL